MFGRVKPYEKCQGALTLSERYGLQENFSYFKTIFLDVSAYVKKNHCTKTENILAGHTLRVMSTRPIIWRTEFKNRSLNGYILYVVLFGIRLHSASDAMGTAASELFPDGLSRLFSLFRVCFFNCDFILYFLKNFVRILSINI